MVGVTFRSRLLACRQLVIVALDFKKAYDSIDRGRLIETLVKFRIHPQVINLIAKVYSGDETVVGLGGREEGIKVTSGIRQGCTASTVLFKLITYVIIEKLHREGAVFRMEGIDLNLLWFADDGTLVANSLEGAARNIRVVKEVSKTFGLEINEKKSAIMIYKGGKGVKKIEGIEVVDSWKYLGVEICNKRDIFKLHKEIVVKKLEGGLVD